MNVIIPISDKTDSLNVSVASGIVMYELKSKK
jgi:tRNA G18 (ribose-2'-O)-methylase SpoU